MNSLASALATLSVTSTATGVAAATAGTLAIARGSANAFAIFGRSGCNCCCIKYN